MRSEDPLESTGRRRLLGAAAAALLAVLAAIALRQMVHQISYHQLRTAIDALPAPRLLAALALTAASYLALTFYDVVALRVIGHPLPWRKAALASFTSYTLSHNLGLALITGGTARFRIYRGEGLEPGAIGTIIALASMTFWCGVMQLAGLALLLQPERLDSWLAFAPPLRYALGLLLLLGGLAPLGIRLTGRTRIALGRWALPLPTPAQSGALALASLVDLATASVALFVLVPGLAPAAWPALFAAYALALIVAQISHVPGGVGVFEAVVIAALPADQTGLLAALFAYRVIYYLIPLFVAAAMLLLGERQALLPGVARGIAATGRIGAHSLAPPVLGGLTFISGFVLLVSGATPAIRDRIDALARVVPLPFMEASHIGASLAGTVLLFVAQGLWRRLDGAALLARVVLVAGAVFSLLKGFDYEEALICLTLAMMVHSARGAFYRRTSLTAEPLSLPWVLAALAALGVMVVTGFFAYAHVEYDNALWWRFVVHDGAPRFLRASLAAATVVMALALWRMLRPAHRAPVGDPFDEERFGAALERASSSEAFMALTGDKRFLYAPEGDAFIMFARQGAAWIMLNDPVGEPARWPALFWRLRELCDEAQGTLLLYQIGENSLPHAIDMGLRVAKYGEEALVDLAGFSLAGPGFKSLRHCHRRALAAGASFAVISAGEAAGIIDELRAVSDAWLADKGQAEKGFSLGRFDPAYLARFPIAVVRCNGRIVAFANLLALPSREELSVDLMRHGGELPYGTMDFLFIELMLWGQREGYARFNLGLAPLAGLPRHRLAPLIGQAGDLLFRRGERFYGFTGLRSFKAKFAPNWTSRYVAAPSHFALLRSMISLYDLVSRPRAEPAARRSPAKALDRPRKRHHRPAALGDQPAQKDQ